VVFGGLSRTTFRLMSDSVEKYTLKLDSTKRELTLTGRFDPKLVRTLSSPSPMRSISRYRASWVRIRS
jgi:hypothetical protein